VSAIQVADRILVSPGVELPYVESGSPDGVPVLMLHGLTDSWRSFEPLLPFYPSEIRGIALTIRGHGEASKPATGYDWSTMSDDIRMVLDTLDIDRAVVVGHSYGSQLAMQFAVRHPGMVRGLVLMGAFSPEPGLPIMHALWDEMFSTIADPIQPGFAWDFQSSTVAQPVAAGWIETAASESLKVPAYVWKSAFEPLLTMDLRGHLNKVRVPVQLIWGDQDAMAGCSDQAALLEAFPISSLSTYYGAGHAVHWEEPERVAEDIAEFVSGLAR